MFDYKTPNVIYSNTQYSGYEYIGYSYLVTLLRMNIFDILIWSGCEEQIYSLYSIDRHKILYIQILSFLVMNIIDIPIWLSC